MSVTCSPVLICAENRSLMANMPIWLTVGKCQTGCITFNPIQPAHLWTSGQFGQTRAHKWPVGGRFVGLWHFSTCSSMYQRADSNPNTDF